MQSTAESHALHARRLVVLAPPLVVEGLRSLGCDIVAATGFVSQLAVLTARNAPSTVIAHVDGRDLQQLEQALHTIRHALPGCRLVLLMSPDVMAAGLDQYSRLGCEVYRQDLDATALQLALGIGFAAPLLLTRREVDVLTLAAEGLSNHSIGRRLGLQLNTVKNYMRSIHRKLGASSRTEAVMIAARAGYPVIRLR
jgi:DNA-binding NarL/FixJ family response regulator